MVSNSGNGIYRCIIVAVAGLILIGARQAPNPPAQTEQGQSRAHQGNAASNASASATEAAKVVDAPKKSQPCADRRCRSNDDLCAQWKAADSASEAAKWAWWQLILSTLGVVGLGITLWFNFRALTRAGEANTIAQNVGSAQTRGYIGLEPSEWTGQFNDAKTELFVNLNIKNWGATPCRKVIIKKAIRLLPINLIDSPIGTDCSDFEQPVTIWPTQSVRAGAAKADRVFTSAEIADALNPNGSNRIYLISLVTYTDFTGAERKTEYLAFIDPGSVERNDGLIVTWIWCQSPKFNNST